MERDSYKEPGKGNILIVDNSLENLKLLFAILSDCSYMVEPGAINIALKTYLDFILLDILMPDIDGNKVCRKLNKFKRLLDEM
ncbi:MAG: hypothetical protein AAFS12_10720 [Cyanobacteria bacterium J06632_19]